MQREELRQIRLLKMKKTVSKRKGLVDVDQRSRQKSTNNSSNSYAACSC